MAASVTTINTPGVQGNEYWTVVDITPDTSYPTGGYALTPANLGFTSRIDYLTTVSKDGTLIPVWNPTTQKLQLFTALGTEATNASNQSTHVIRCLALGV